MQKNNYTDIHYTPIQLKLPLEIEKRDFIKLLSDGYQHRSHNKNLLMVHLIFVTKYRKALLHGKIRDSAKQLLFSACAKHHWYIRRMETDRDHIHILVQYNPSDSITKIASVLKQYSTFHLWQQYASLLKRYYWKERTFWSDGYFACSIGQVSRDVIEGYIANQGQLSVRVKMTLKGRGFLWGFMKEEAPDYFMIFRTDGARSP